MAESTHPQAPSVAPPQPPHPQPQPHWSASARYGLDAAPEGLGLVQDLLNTVPAGTPLRPDLLDRVDDAQAWLDAAVAAWCAATGRTEPRLLLTGDADVARLRALREELVELTLRRQASGESAEHEAAECVLLQEAAAALHLGPDGVVRMESRGDGWRRLASLLLVGLCQAQGADQHRRLKICRNPACRVAFYDRSRNNSGVWHSVRTCGNAANLRAHRARRRSTPSDSPAETGA